MVIQGVTYPSDFEAKKAMAEIAARMAAKDYVIAGDGSLSVRTGPNAVWITEADADKASLTQDKFIRVDMNGKQMMSAHPRRLPEDLPIHLKLYAENDALRGVLHAYPATAAVLSAMGCGVQAADYSPAVRALGAMQLLPAAPAEELARAAALRAKAENGILLTGDGCMLWGASIGEAFHRLQALEYYAKLARLLGSCPTQTAQPACPAPAPAYSAPAPAVPARSTPPADGLTPLIKPGDAAAFRLPGGGAPAARPAAPAISAPAGRPPVTAPAAVSAAVPQADAPRARVMAEVVRRSLANLK